MLAPSLRYGGSYHVRDCDTRTIFAVFGTGPLHIIGADPIWVIVLNRDTERNMIVSFQEIKIGGFSASFFLLQRAERVFEAT
jgi:hypothetical protein